MDCEEYIPKAFRTNMPRYSPSTKRVFSFDGHNTEDTQTPPILSEVEALSADKVRRCVEYGYYPYGVIFHGITEDKSILDDPTAFVDRNCIDAGFINVLIQEEWIGENGKPEYGVVHWYMAKTV